MKLDNLTFEQKIKKLEQTIDAGWNYLDSLAKSYRLTVGFWNKYGYRVEKIQQSLWDHNRKEWAEYRKSKGQYVDLDFKPNVEDNFC